MSGLQRLYAAEHSEQAGQEAQQSPVTTAPAPRQPEVQPPPRRKQQQNQVGVFRYPDARQKNLAIRPFGGKELYVGLVSGFFDWDRKF